MNNERIDLNLCRVLENLKKGTKVDMNKEWFADYKEQILLNNVEEARKVLLDNVDKNQMIYRYRKGLNRDLQNLKSNQIWLGSAFYFNDPYDCLVTVDCGLKVNYPMNQRKEAMETYMRQEKENRKTEALRSALFVACFSETNNSFPMWGYYAADHKGMCLGYNLYDLVEKYQCMPVIYSNELLFYGEDSSERNILANTLTKSDEWIHEREWRIVIKDDINVGKSGIIRDFVLPKEIYIGCQQQKTIAENNDSRMSQNKEENKMYANLDDILQWAENNYIDVYMPIISRKEYKMVDRLLKLI